MGRLSYNSDMARPRLGLVHQYDADADSQATFSPDPSMPGSAQAQAQAGTTTKPCGEPDDEHVQIFGYGHSLAQARLPVGAVGPTDELEGGIAYVRALSHDGRSSIAVYSGMYIFPSIFRCTESQMVAHTQCHVRLVTRASAPSAAAHARAYGRAVQVHRAARAPRAAPNEA